MTQYAPGSWSMDSIHEIRIGRVAHEDNWSYWESLIAEGEDIANGRTPGGSQGGDAAHALYAYTERANLEAALASAQTRKAPVLLRLPASLWIDLMDQHGFLGDLEDMSGEAELRSVGMAHRRAALTIYKHLIAHGFEVRHPDHWWR